MVHIDAPRPVDDGVVQPWQLFVPIETDLAESFAACWSRTRGVVGKWSHVCCCFLSRLYSDHVVCRWRVDPAGDSLYNGWCIAQLG